MSKIRNTLVIVTIVALLAVSASLLIGIDAAVAEDPEKMQLAPLNSELVEFLENPPGEFYGDIPPTMDLSHLGRIPVEESRPLEGALPGSFDWRGPPSKVTPVKDQSPCGACWTFAATSALESKVMVDEDVENDFSEQSVALCVDRSWVYLYDDSDEPCGLIGGHGGGNAWLAAEVFIRKGSVEELCNPYSGAGLQCDGTCACDDCPPVKVVDGFRVRAGDGSDIDTIKNAIYNYGPAKLSYYHSTAYEYWNETWGAIYDYYPSPSATNHAVTVVGWDDDVPHPNPSHSGTGAWIIKNSWGTSDSWADDAGVSDGYFYLAYDSSNVQRIIQFLYKDPVPGEELLYWDEAGWVASGGYSDTSAWMASIFTSEQDSDLTHVDFWTTDDNAAYELYVYDGSFGSELASQTGTCEEAGYYSIPLTTPVLLSSTQQFTIAVKMTNPDYNKPLAVELQSSGVCEPPIQSGVCFTRHNDTDAWVDADGFAGVGVNVCLRARVLTVVNTPPELSAGMVDPASGYTTDDFTYSVTYTDADNNPPSSITVSIDSGTPVDMTEQDEMDTDYTDGKGYEYATSGLDKSSHTFQFAASDGIDDAIGDTDPHDGPIVQNTPPSVGGVAITPDPAYTSDNLTANPSGWSDPDGEDTEGYQWQWQKYVTDSWVDIGDGTDTLASSEFVRDDWIKVICTPFDGTDTGTPVEDDITISNTPPLDAEAVDVTPDAPLTTDDLQCLHAIQIEEPDGDTVTYSYAWYKDDVEQPGLTGNTVDSSYTLDGEVWKCVVTPYDGYEYGAPGEDTVVIGNSPPSVGGVAISPDPAYTDNDLTANPSGWSDADDDPEGYQWQWQKYVTGSWQDIDGATGSTLDSSNFVRDDWIKVICTPFDGKVTGDPVEDDITISNTPPLDAEAVDVFPDAPLTTDDLQCLHAIQIDEPDGDTVTYSYDWYKDGVLQPALTVYIVYPTSTSKGEVWRCVVTPYDGYEYGAPGEDEVTIGNSPPSAPVVDVTPDAPSTNDDLICTIVTTSDDPDAGDTITYSYVWYKDDVEQPGLTGNTVDSSYTSDGEVWKCVVTPNDGYEDGTPGEDEVTIGGPALSDGTVDPTSGKTSTNFTYYVVYTDGDNDAPATITVTIDSGTPEGMTEQDPADIDYTDGKVYEYAVRGSNLGVGEHEFQFAASDGTYDAGGDIGVHSGPTVSAGGGGMGGGGVDRNPPRISEIVVSNITKTSADISWKTHEQSNGQVEYRASPPMLSELIEETTLAHNVHLTGLTPATTYYFKVMSMDRSENLSVSDEQTFKTLGTPATFVLSDLSVSPAEVDIGEAVTVSVVVANTGDVGGTYEVALNVAETVVDAKEVTLAGGASQTVTFNLVRDVAGSCSVSIGGLTCSFAVKTPPPPPAPALTPESTTPTPAPEGTNWWLIGAIVAGCLAIGLLGYFFVWRRRGKADSTRV